MTTMTPISELFQRDPLQLNEKDLSEIIAYFRRERAEFIVSQASAKKPSKKTSVTADDLIADMLGDN